MVDRRANTAGAGTRLALFARALLLLTLIAVVIPWALVLAARERFGGASPFHGAPSPRSWSASRVRDALTERLTDQTIADIIIRLALVLAWVGVFVIVVTVIAEAGHMVRHDGLAMPDVRGLGLSQRTARVIAAGLLVVVPLVASPTGALARGGTSELPDRASASELGAGPSGAVSNAPTSRVASGEVPPPTSATVSPGRYVVKPGDSIFGIAERLVGPDSSRVAAFAEQLVDLNMGREMSDGRHFDNAAFIDVGWVLELPDTPASTGASRQVEGGADVADVHVVGQGETLWSIADDELGDPSRWPEVYDANEGRTFADGRRLDDPDLIQPGWELDVPTVADASDVSGVPVVSDVSDVSGVPVVSDVSDVSDVSGVPVVSDVSIDEVAAPVDDTVAPLTESDVEVPDRVGDSPERIDSSVRPDAPTPAMTPVTVDADPSDAPADRDNIWHEADAVPAVAPGPRDGHGERLDRGPVEPPVDQRDTDDSSVPGLLTLGGAAMLSAGVLTLLAVRRRNQLRRARPRAALPEPTEGPAVTERALRAIDTGERFDRVESAIRGVAFAIAEQDERIEVVLVGPDGGLELRTGGPTQLPSPWEGGGTSWHLAASTPLELLVDAARSIGTPCPTLVQLGTHADGRDVYVDLEAIEAIEIGGSGAHADSIVAAVAATLAGSLLAEVTTLVGVGVPDDAFLGHRRYVPVRDGRRAFDAAADAIGSTAAMPDSTFVLRATGTATETWEPAVVLAGSAAGTMSPPADRRGLAIVSASPIHGPSSRLAPDGDAWVLLPADIRLTPVGLTPADIGAIAELVTVIDPVPTHLEPGRPDPATLERTGPVDDRTLVPGSVDDESAAVAFATEPEPDPVVPVTPEHELLVRMIGPVDVVDREGSPVVFERSKTRELIAWLATHRERSTRSSARTALWELDVRDATFANVVSEARRSLARLVEPPAGEEWVARTMTDSLPLHDLVITDADVIRHALDAARLQPPAQAVATLSPAVELIAGVPFEGTSYLWPDSEGITSNLVLLATSATTELAAHCLSIGDIDGVFRATGRGLQVLPGHEALIGLRMEAHARAGDHAGVRQEWESYERVINADPWSDGEPAPKLVELRQQLLNPSR